MVNSRQSATPLALLCWLLGANGFALADDEPLPDLDFLEYLGSWAESDADWEIVARAIETEQLVTDEKRTDPAKKEEESVETDDES